MQGLDTQGHRVFKKCDWLEEEGLVHHCTIVKSKTGPQGKVRNSSQADCRIDPAVFGDVVFKGPKKFSNAWQERRRNPCRECTDECVLL